MVKKSALILLLFYVACTTPNRKYDYDCANPDEMFVCDDQEPVHCRCEAIKSDSE